MEATKLADSEQLLKPRPIAVAHAKQHGRDNGENHGEDRMGEEGEK